MNKLELIKLINSLNLPIEEYSVISGRALLMSGLRLHTADLDIKVTEKGFELLKNKFTPILIDNSKKQYKLTEDIECFVTSKLDSTINYINGYPCESLISIYKFKKKLNRPKDQEDILAIERILNIK